MPYIAVFFYQSENTSKMVENENKAYSIDTITTNCDTHYFWFCRFPFDNFDVKVTPRYGRPI